jgi:hypothetical protein
MERWLSSASSCNSSKTAEAQTHPQSIAFIRKRLMFAGLGQARFPSPVPLQCSQPPVLMLQHPADLLNLSKQATAAGGGGGRR